MFLAVYIALHRANKIYLTIAMLLALLGLAVYLSSHTVFSMLSLSHQYAATEAETQKSILLASGQAMLAIYEGSGVDVGLVLFMIAVLMISAIMLQNDTFIPAIAWVGILAGGLALAYYILRAFTPNAIFIFEASGLFFLIWIFMVGQRLLQLARTTDIEKLQ